MRYDRGWRTLLTALMAWGLIVLMIAPDNFDYYALKINDATPTEGSMLSRSLWIALLVIGVVVVMSRIGAAMRLLKAMNPFLLLFSALAIVSFMWSIEPEVTIRRGVRVITFLLDAMALAIAGWHPERFQNLVRPPVTAMLAGSIVFGLVSPELAIHEETASELIGAWHGLASHKNALGALSCMGVIFWAHAWLSRQSRIGFVLIGLGISLTCLVLSRSSTSMIVMLLCVSFLVLHQKGPTALRHYMPWLVSLFIVMVVLYSGVILDVVPGSELLLKPITHFAGKDKSFTGRADIWNIIMDHIQYHKMLGTGYGAYWTGPFIGKASYVFLERMQFYPYSAHNGYLEIVNDLGFVGLACLAGFLIFYVRQALQLNKTDHVQASLFLALFIQQAFLNLSESHWLSVLSVGNVIMCFATACLARALIEQRAQVQAYRAQRMRAAYTNVGVQAGAQMNEGVADASRA